MPLAPDILRRIVARSATLAERLKIAAQVCGVCEADEADVARRLARWTTLVARGDAARFERRLRFDGITDAEVRCALASSDRLPHGPLPEWAGVLSEAVDDDAPIALSHVVQAFTLAARRRVALRAGPALARFEAAALDRLEEPLRRQLATTATPVFQLAREQERRLLPALFTEYASLARLLATQALHWASATASLIARLDADVRALEAAFANGGSLGAVVDARTGLSDPHRAGQTVGILRFACGATIVYKPRSVKAEQIFANVVDWLGARMDAPVLTALRVIDRDAYGWMEYAQAAECADEAAVCRYYERAGMLLAAMYALCGGDLHQENIIGCGEHPVPIDLEVMAAPLLQPERVADDPGPWSHILGSVLATSMLPILHARFDDTAASSGILDTHPDEVMAGFRRMYRALAEHRVALVAPNGPLAGLEEARVRIVLRPTRVYLGVFERCTAPRYLRNGVDRSIELEVLRQPFTVDTERHRLWTALSAELDALEANDVPLFDIDAGGTALRTSRGPIEEYVAESGAARVRARLAALDERDLERQAHFIRMSCSAHRHRQHAPPAMPDLLLAGATDAAHLLDELALPAGDGRTWQGISVAPVSTPLDDVGPSLATGRAGIALFFAAMARATSDDTYRRLALSAFGSAEVAPSTSIGLAHGDAGIAYALVTASRCLDEPPLLRAAERIAARLTAERIERMPTADVWDGAAGALLALLALHDATGRAEVLARATTCGRHLIAARGWLDQDNRAATGFAHGASGIAHALLALYRRTGARGFRHAAIEAQTRAAAAFVPSPREPGWSRGPAGIGLSRVANLDVYDSAANRGEIDAALQLALAKPLDKPDHVYGGNLGRAELLDVAGSRLGRPDLNERARTTASAVVERARKRGTYGGGIFESAFSPGLFDGLAGVGYELLRLRPGSGLPSLLLFE